MRLHDLRAPKGARKKRKRVGRGESSGFGKTSGRGHGGQKSRSGTGKPKLGFEGGQTPMFRRLPKRGFVNVFAKRFSEINLDILTQKFKEGDHVNLESLRGHKLMAKKDEGVRILGRGEINFSLTVEAHHITKGARKSIEDAGGKVIVIGKKKV